MIKWFCNKIVKWGLKYSEDQNNREIQTEREERGAVKGNAVEIGSAGIDMDRAIRFNVLVCQGGVVLEMRTIDHDNSAQPKGYSSNQSRIRTHIIADGEPVAERIGQIVSLEILRA